MKKNNEKILGIVGGFGAYATLDFQNKIFEKFKGDSERCFPHIICDNNFKMPSRTKALLTGEDYDIIVNDITKSLKNMVYLDVDYIVLPCGTAHYFLKDVYNSFPEAKERVINIIECSGLYLKECNVKKILIIAAEGTLKKHLYNDIFSQYGIECVEPGEEFFVEIRFFIECVKTNNFEDLEDIKIRFLDFVRFFNVHDILLGCTEFPVLLSKILNKNDNKDELNNYSFFDPLEIVCDNIFNKFNCK